MLELANQEHRRRAFSEKRRITAVYFLTDIFLYWFSLSVVTWARVDTLHEVNFILLERDRWICITIFAIAAILVGCYRSENILDRFDSLYYIFIALVITGVVEFALATLLRIELRVISRTELALGAMLGTVLLLCWHFLAVGIACRFPSLHRFFYVLGTESEAKAIVEEICASREARVTARYITPENLKAEMERRKQKSETNLLIEDAIVTTNNRNRSSITELLETCEKYCRHTYLYPSVDDTLLFQHQNFVNIVGLPLIEVASQDPSKSYLLLKSAMDVVIAALALILVAPILLIAAVAIVSTSPGGVFYLQERLGKGGKPFKIIKFRSMAYNSGSKRGDRVRAIKRDPRITAVGRIIRKYKIDELPQFVNVLRGEMSLVGPRPLWREFFSENGENSALWERRLTVRPGITSLLHTQGHSFQKASNFLRYDLIYINNISLLNDMKILAGTIRIVLSGKGSDV